MSVCLWSNIVCVEEELIWEQSAGLPNFGKLWGPRAPYGPLVGFGEQNIQPVHIYGQKASIWLLIHENRPTSLRDTFRTRFGASRVLWSESKTTQPVHIYGQKASIWLLNHQNRPTSLKDTFRTSFGASRAFWAPYGPLVVIGEQNDPASAHLWPQSFKMSFESQWSAQ